MVAREKAGLGLGLSEKSVIFRGSPPTPFQNYSAVAERGQKKPMICSSERNVKPSAELGLQFAGCGIHAGGREKTEDGFFVGGDALAGGPQLTHFPVLSG